MLGEHNTKSQATTGFERKTDLAYVELIQGGKNKGGGMQQIQMKRTLKLEKYLIIIEKFHFIK